MEEIEAGLYDICYILAERIRQLEVKMESIDKQREILSKAITEKDMTNITKNNNYYY